jgi:hypothetical protein
MLIRHAILASFKDMRANDWLLDYVAQGLLQDDLTKDVYGQKEIDGLKKWFKNTEIPVLVSGSLVDVKAPAVTIALVSSNEQENTLGDVHYVPQEDVQTGPWPDLTPKFDAIFDPPSGLVTIPIGIAIQIFPGMNIMDAQGRPHEILDVTSDRVFTIAPGVPFDFRGATIRSGSPATLQTLESAAFTETYQIGCHVGGEPLQLIFLHSLLVFMLKRGNQVYLEGRGFEKSTITSADFAKNEYYNVENAWTRYISITGTVRTTWPKFRTQKITGVVPYIAVSGAGNLPPDSQPAKEQLWIGDKDIDSLG